MRLDEQTRSNIRQFQHIAIDRPTLVSKNDADYAKEMNHHEFEHFFVYNSLWPTHGIETTDVILENSFGPLETFKINQKCRDLITSYEKLLLEESKIVLEIDMNSKCYKALVIDSAYTDETTEDYAMRLLEASAIGVNGAML
jgi:hypothetical protein